MRIQEFLVHHGISRNPFAEEDAQTDVVFKDHCIDSTYHVVWEKVFGDPTDPSTSIVFGEKGAGKTALRLQIQQHVALYNEKNPDHRLFVIEYDDFNPFLDRFREHSGRRFRRIDKLLGAWQLRDHMDAILSLGVTKLANQIVGGLPDKDGQRISREQISGMARHQRRDLLLLAACYDQSKQQTALARWKTLKRKLRFGTWQTYFPILLGWFGMLLAAGLFGVLAWYGNNTDAMAPSDETAISINLRIPVWVYGVVVLLAWAPWLWKLLRRWWLAQTIVRRLRVGVRNINPLCRVLMRFTKQDTLGQPFPNKDRTDDRYELLGKFQNVLEQLGYSGILVLVDRLDEPHLINGQAELMRAFLWPLLDNKFLKHPGVGIKMMLPMELRRFIDREDRDFYQRARLDKQNMIPSLQWTGEALYDLANSRIQACAKAGKAPSLRQLFDESVTNQRMIEGFRTLRVPRHLFKFLYRLLVAHCNAYTDDKPMWVVTNHMFESVLAVYDKEIEASDRGTGI